MKSCLLGTSVSRMVRARRIVAAMACLMCVQGTFAAVINTQVWSGNGHTYHLLTSSSWSQAEGEAVSSLGGHLATINDQAEHNWVWSTFAPLINPASSAGLWIGHTDSESFGASEENWRWISGESPGYTNWESGEPNDFPTTSIGEDFAFMGLSNNGRWFDADNAGSGNAGYGVVEVVPIPPSLWLFGSGLLGLVGVARRKAA